MKTHLLILAMMTVVAANAQSIGDTFKHIHKKIPGGEARMFAGLIYYEYIDTDTGAEWTYYFSYDMVCESITAKVHNQEEYLRLVDDFNSEWDLLRENHWKYARTDGSVLEVSLQVQEEEGPMFIIYRTK